MRTYYDQTGSASFEAGGVRATIERGALYVVLPRPRDTRQALGVVGALWDVWTFARDHLHVPGLPCIVDASELDGLPQPLANVLALINLDLSAKGRRLVVVGTRN